MRWYTVRRSSRRQGAWPDSRAKPLRVPDAYDARRVDGGGARGGAARRARPARCRSAPSSRSTARSSAAGSTSRSAPAIRRRTPRSSRFATRRARVGNYRLTGATLCVTIEPCLMCVGRARARADRHAGVRRARSRDPARSSRPCAAASCRASITGSRSWPASREEECRELMQAFFRDGADATRCRLPAVTRQDRRRSACFRMLPAVTRL